MTYRDRQNDRSGSFRGVPFLTPANERKGGRRGALHEYPGSDQHTSQDLGLMAQRFMVTALVMGPDYDVTRDALIAALEKGGPGKLVHRFYGEMQAELEPGNTYSVTETQDEGGKALFQIPFVRAGKPTNPSVTFDAVARVRSAATASKNAALTSFLNKVSNLRAITIQSVQDVNNILAEVNNRISGALATPSNIAGQIQALADNVETLCNTPSRFGELAEGLYAIGEALYEVLIATGASITSLRNLRDQLRELFVDTGSEARKILALIEGALTDLTAPEPSVADPSEQAVFALVAQGAAIESARAAVEVPYDSRDTATNTRDIIGAALLDQAEASNDDDLYAELIDLRVELSRHLSITAGTLPRVVEYMPVRTLPALLIAHLVHGDATRVDEIIARNNIAHPGFVPGGRALKVLSDGV